MVNVVGTCVMQSVPRLSHFRRFSVKRHEARESRSICLRLRCDTLRWWKSFAVSEAVVSEAAGAELSVS